MVSYKAEFSAIGFEKLKYNPIRYIDSKTPGTMSLGVQFLNSKRRVKRIVFEKLSLFYGLFLDRLRKVFEEPVEGCSGRNFHLFIFKKLREGLPFGNTTFFVVFL